MWRRVYLFFVLICLFFLPSFAYTIKYTTSPNIFPGPGNNITFTVLKDDGDVSPIDVILVNTAGDGNITTVIDSLSPDRNNNLVVDVPKDSLPGQYLLRFVDHSTKKFILDSSTFQIYASGTTSSASSSSTSSATSNSASATNTASNSKSKKSNVGPIVGGVVGGVVLIVLLALLFLCWRRRKHRLAGKQDISNEKTLPKSPTSTQAARIDPFTIAPRPRLPPNLSTPYSETEISDTTSGAHPSSFGLGSGATTGAVSSGKGGYISGHGYRPSTNTMDSSSASMSPSSDLTSPFRPSRSDIHTTAPVPSTVGSLPGSSGPSAVEVSRENELTAQILRLQEQVNQIEARQALESGGGAEDFSVPPPVYDGPPAVATPPVLPSQQTSHANDGRPTVSTIASSAAHNVKNPLP